MNDTQEEPVAEFVTVKKNEREMDDPGVCTIVAENEAAYKRLCAEIHDDQRTLMNVWAKAINSCPPMYRNKVKERYRAVAKKLVKFLG